MPMKYYLVSFTIGLAVGLALSFLFYTSVDKLEPSKAIAKNTAILKKEVAKSEVSYSKVFDSLKSQTSKLQSQLGDTKGELARVKQKNYSLQLTVYDLIDRNVHNYKEDAETNNNCDTLIRTVEQLMQSSSEKDSLYESVTVNLESQLKNKDSTIALDDRKYYEMKNAFDKSIQNTNQLSIINKKQNKQVNKQKIKSKVLSAALFIVTGAFINQIIHH